MANKLDDLISDKNTAKTGLAAKVDDGEAAKLDLAEVLEQIEALGEIQALRDTALAQATQLVADSKAAVAPLQTSPAYTTTAAAVAAGVTAKGKTEAGLTGVVGAALPMGGTYASYVTTLTTAESDLADDIADEAAKRIALAAQRGLIDVRIASLTTYATSVAARLARARTFLTSATLAAQQNSVAAAWWALHHVKALLAQVSAADATTLATAVTNACEDYATAYDAWTTAHDQLAQSIAARDAAAAKLAQADAQTLAALATFLG